MNQTKTGGLIRALRTQKRLTQKVLAKAVGISDKAITKWKRALHRQFVHFGEALRGIAGGTSGETVTD